MTSSVWYFNFFSLDTEVCNFSATYSNWWDYRKSSHESCTILLLMMSGSSIKTPKKPHLILVFRNDVMIKKTGWADAHQYILFSILACRSSYKRCIHPLSVLHLSDLKSTVITWKAFAWTSPRLGPTGPYQPFPRSHSSSRHLSSYPLFMCGFAFSLQNSTLGIVGEWFYFTRGLPGSEVDDILVPRERFIWNMAYLYPTNICANLLCYKWVGVRGT